jgi:hypothetical protein
MIEFYIFASCMMIATYNFHGTWPQNQNMVDHNYIYGAYYICIGSILQLQ